MLFKLNKKKIFFLYQKYLLLIKEKNFPLDLWIVSFLQKEKQIQELINSKLKIGWEFSRLPYLEKAILVYASYELLFSKFNEKIIIDQIINFSKNYLENNKHKYINKILDLIFKEKKIILNN